MTIITPLANGFAMLMSRLCLCYVYGWVVRMISNVLVRKPVALGPVASLHACVWSIGFLVLGLLAWPGLARAQSGLPVPQVHGLAQGGQQQALGKVVVGTADLIYGEVSRQSGHSHPSPSTLNTPPAAPFTPLRKGMQLFEGDTVQTGQNGHLYLATTDQAFISVRPNSRLTIELYRAQPNDPSNVSIRFTLHEGVARFVSGQAVSTAKNRFRLNTPVAAIGVRGTDFTVFTSESVTRASVMSGRIAVSPFSEGCVALGFGPCQGRATVDLAAGEFPVIELSRGDKMPRLIRSEELSPDRVVPPRNDERPSGSVKPNGSASPEPYSATSSVPSSPSSASTASSSSEPVAAASPDSSSPVSPVPVASSVDAAGVVSPATESLAANAVSAGSFPPDARPLATELPNERLSVDQGLSSIAEIRAEERIANPLGGGAIDSFDPPPVLPDPVLHWGRWKAIAQLPAESVLASQGADPIQVAAILGPYLIWVDQAALGPVPLQGRASFLLRDHEVVLLPPLGQQQAQAITLGVENPELTVDFAARTYSTQLDLTGAPGGTLGFRSRGGLTGSGQLRNDNKVDPPGVALRGQLAGPEAQQAGYAFELRLAPDVGTVSGVTRWAR